MKVLRRPADFLLRQCASLAAALVFFIPAATAAAAPTGLRQVGRATVGAGEFVSTLLPLDDHTVLTDAGSVYDLTDPTTPRRIADAAWSGTEIEVRGSIGYLAARRDGLVILDLRDPAQLTRLGGYRTGGDALALEVQNGLAYLATADAGLRVIDVANPARTDQAGYYPSSLADSLVANDLVLRTNLAYVAAGPDTLEILRVGNPSSILRAGGLRTGLNTRWIRGTDNLLLLAGEFGGLVLIDIAAPTQPVALGSYPRGATDSPWSAILLDQSVVYAAAGTEGVLLVDCSNPNQPRLAGSYHPSSPVLDLDRIGNHILAAQGAAGFAVLEPVANAVAAPRITEPPRATAVPLGAAARFTVLAEPANGLSYQWFRADQPIAGATLSTLDFAAVTADQDGFYAVEVSNDSGSVRSDPVRLQVLLPPTVISQPSNVTVLEGDPIHLSVSVPTDPPVEYQWFKEGIALDGATRASLDFAAATPEHAGTYSVRIQNVAGTVRSRNAVVDVHRRITLRQLGRWPASPDGEFANRVRLAGHLLYLAQGAAGLQILDVSDPTQPQRVGGYFGGGYAGGFEIVGDRLYLADGNVGGLSILDLADPTRPTRLGRLTLAASANDVRVVGRYAYVAYSVKGLAIVDVSDPAVPKIVGRIPESYGAARLDVSAGWAYVADTQGGLLICRVDDPTQPVPVTQFAKPLFGEYSVRDIQVAGTLAYYTMTYDGFGIADVSDPARPVAIGHVSGYSTSVRVQDGYAYVGRADGGLRVLDVSTPARPLVVADLDTPGEVGDVAVSFNRVYVADGKNGVLVLESNLATAPVKPSLTWERSPDGSGLRLRCPGGLTTILERSTDLHAWTPIRTNPPGPVGTTTEFLIDPPSPGSAAFYRVGQFP